MATERETPARSRFRTAVRRKSWKMRCGLITRGFSETSVAKPAFRQAVIHARRNDLMGTPCRWNTHGMTLSSFVAVAFVAIRCASRRARPCTLDAAVLARLLVRHRRRRSGDAPPGLRPPAHAV